jgi:hypothetical protein
VRAPDDLDRVPGHAVTVRPDVHARFRQVVARAIARADQEHAEHLKRIQRLPPLPSEGGRERISELRRPPRRRR